MLGMLCQAGLLLAVLSIRSNVLQNVIKMNRVIDSSLFFSRVLSMKLLIKEK